MLSGHTASCKCSGSQTSIGEGVKTLNSVSISGSGSSGIYEIETENGKLTETQRNLTLKCDNQEKTYDGTALNATNTCSVTSGSLLSGHNVSCTCSGSQTEVGESAKTIESASVTGSGSADVYNISPKDGKLKVKAISITVKADNQSKTYNGSALTANNDCTITSGSLLSGHSMSCSCSGSQTSVGSSTKSLDSVTISGTGADGSYNVTTVDGTLTVESDIPSDATSCSKYYYSIYYECVNSSGTPKGHTSSKTGYSSSGDASTACGTALSGIDCGSMDTVKPSSCSGSVYTHWSIGYKDDSGTHSAGPYSSKEAAKNACGDRPKCWVSCG